VERKIRAKRCGISLDRSALTDVGVLLGCSLGALGLAVSNSAICSFNGSMVTIGVSSGVDCPIRNEPIPTAASMDSCNLGVLSVGF
jgi:hypothetical protein